MGTDMYFFETINELSFGIGFFSHFDRAVDPDIVWNDRVFLVSGSSWND